MKYLQNWGLFKYNFFDCMHSVMMMSKITYSSQVILQYSYLIINIKIYYLLIAFFLYLNIFL